MTMRERLEAAIEEEVDLFGGAPGVAKGWGRPILNSILSVLREPDETMTLAAFDAYEDAVSARLGYAVFGPAIEAALRAAI